MIAALVKENPPRSNRKGQYHLNRRYRNGLWLDIDIRSDGEDVEGVSGRDATNDRISEPEIMAGRRRKMSALSFVDNSRSSDGHVAKRRRVDKVTRVSDVEAGRTGSGKTLSSMRRHRLLEFYETVLGDPSLIRFYDDVNTEFPSYV
jgi:hypothetical protein